MSSKPHYVFVYGSLLSGLYNHYHLNEAKLLGEATSATHSYSMWVGHTKSFPFLIEGSEKAYGELYEVNEDTLRKLDVLESHPNFYQRFSRVFECRGVYITAWVYMFQNSVQKMERVYGNDWKKFLETQKEQKAAATH
jgi:gamma-glutamylcyclotransferase (GGCT)/AIG2-like uncharacterized protein YtfP